MTAKEIFKTLVLGDFPNNLIKNVYPINPKQSVYVIGMNEVCEPNREFGKEKEESPGKSYFRHDAILSLLPGKEERKNGAVFDYHFRQVSIEIKRTLSDLLRDEKIPQYLGAVHYCFLAVPKRLLSDGIEKIRSFEDCENLVGLINADNGDIVIMPDSQEEIQVRERQDRLLANMHCNPKWFDEPEEEYRPHKYLTGQEPDLFVERKGLMISKNYETLLK